MNAILYLLQVSGCMAVFYLFYYLMLSRLTFFTINRYYLLGTLVLSFIIPLLTIHVTQYEPVIQSVVYLHTIQNLQDHKQVVAILPTAAPQPGINWLQVSKLIYMVVAATLFMHLLITLLNFFVKLKRKNVKRVGHIHILHGGKKLANGSFLNYIFLNDDELSAIEIEQVIAHEMLHVKLFHSVDRIIFKIVQIILWFNPVAYLYARSAEENHEFEVDRELTRSTNKGEYANLLLHLSVAAQGMLFNNFSTAPLKKRITMLFNKPSANMKKLIYVLIVPVLVLSCMAFATFKKDIEGHSIINKLSKPLEGLIITDRAQTKVLPLKITASETEPKISPVSDNDNDKTLSDVSQKNSDTTKRYSIIDGVDKLGPNPLVLINGKEYPSSILYQISRSCIRATAMYGPEGAVKKFGDKAKNGCVEITIKGVMTYLTQFEQENMAKEAAIPKTQFYARLQLKDNDGNLYDRIIINDVSGMASGYAEITHNAKVAFFIDKDFYNEDAFKKMPREKLASFTGESGIRCLDQKKYPNVNLHGYGAIFTFRIKGVPPEMENDNYHWELLLPKNE